MSGISGEERRKGVLFSILSLLLLAGTLARADEKEQFSLLADQPLKLSGFTQVGYVHLADDPDEFRIRRARISLKGDIFKNMSYRLQMDAVKSPALLDALAEINFSPYVRVTFGQFKVPFSSENLSPSSALDTINRSQAVEKLCPGRDIGSQGRDIGLSVSGKYSGLEYAAGVFNGSGMNRKDADEKKDFAGRMVLHPFGLLTMAAAFYKGMNSPSSGALPVARNRTGLEIIFLQSSFSVKGECIFARDDQTLSSGWYFQGGYFIAGKLQSIIRYDSYDKNRDMASDRSDLLIFGLNWFFSEKTKLQVNCEWNKKERRKFASSAILAQFQAGF